MLEELPSPPSDVSCTSTSIRLTSARPPTTPASTQHNVDDSVRCRRHPDHPPSPRRRRRCHPGSRRRRTAEPDDRDMANERERARMKTLSRAFSRLKAALPWVPADTKLSKLDTLRLATSYIAHLNELLQMASSESSSLDGVSCADTEEAGMSNHNRQNKLASNSITTMSWPFTRSSRRLALSRLQTTTTTTTTDQNSKSTKC